MKSIYVVCCNRDWRFKGLLHRFFTFSKKISLLTGLYERNRLLKPHQKIHTQAVIIGIKVYAN